MLRIMIAVGLVVLLAACGTAGDGGHATRVSDSASASSGASGASDNLVRPAILAAAQPIQCVPYARALSGIEIYGDAHTWWDSAKGRYSRGNRPALGAVLVLRTKSDARGHLAVVTRIIDDRRIVVEHANWLNRGQIHKETPVRDVSAAGDWSAVRVWYTPAQVWGKSTYEAEGFIYPDVMTASTEDMG